VDNRQIVARRTFLADLGRGAFALAVISLTGCSPAALTSPGRSGAAATASSGSSPTDGESPGAGAASSATASSSSASGDSVAWERVNLGFVSAYILVRGGEAAIVDTGVAGSADDIEASMTGAGLDWSAVGHLILTHKHGDHVGSAADVLANAPDALGYAGAEDIGAISLPRPLTAVGDGDTVFGLTIVTTPGHTPGSISVYDPIASLLVAGDALGIDGGKPTLPGASFTEDMDLAKQSIVKLGALTFETLLVGHGDPLESGGSQAVAELGASS
jgi:glyoxylase-like metal-dependent hydrolase (beta-lactamase superfamily II)